MKITTFIRNTYPVGNYELKYLKYNKTVHKVSHCCLAPPEQFFRYIMREGEYMITLCFKLTNGQSSFLPL